ncbi:hypothetical protein O7626_00525 [Micromonospora sp. WMMD1102]|uniref:hypothetical protein n=1 Tax=Micromonospora sp. WMMD1102 TaxID=3016105 RepID=UPI00241554D0|nr:hypothetical protein [Micromonospora sp. WMMD1102]MDG4784431.1 hypothetical protein [Micromonospora sp. WMMD1102]
MARLHGRRGRVYMGIASDTAEASPLPFIATWSMNFVTDKQDVTAMEDTNKVYVAGLPDASGEFGGFYDDASAQTYTAATDGQPRKFYLYPDRSTNTKYFFGTVLPDFSVNAGVSAAAAISASWNAASSIVKVG